VPSVEEAEDAFTAQRLIAAGVLSREGGQVDVNYYVLLLNSDSHAVRGGLLHLSQTGRITKSDGWCCSGCSAENPQSRVGCHDCSKDFSASDPSIELFFRPSVTTSRDPAALFLIHGMNTSGDWQQSLAWKTQLYYTYSVPVFVFKFGRDWLSPFRHRSQSHLVKKLATAIRQTQADLMQAGRTAKCDVVAHSLGSLLLSQLLDASEFNDITLGRVVITGSIVPRDFDWQRHLSQGRLEALMNHRAGRDVWVRLAPWFFPNAGSSGYDGFCNLVGLVDHLSPTFGHSDFFAAAQFDDAFRGIWIPFLASSANAVIVPPVSIKWLPRQRTIKKRYWIGRITLLAIAVISSLLALATIIAFCAATTRLLASILQKSIL
jgi:hypothetical protein